MSKNLKITLIVIIVAVSGMYLAWNLDWYRLPGEPTDYFSCIEAGGVSGVAPGTEGTSLSSCSYYGKWFSYDG